MLVLSRKVGQRIVLPEMGVTFRVLDIRRNQVRIGIQAPSNTPVHRDEIWGRICNAEPVAATRSSVTEHSCEYPTL